MSLSSLSLRPHALRATRLFSSTSHLHLPRPIPTKDHLHQHIPDSHFPQGYIVTSTHSGIKKKPGVPDLGVLLSTSPQTSAAACFTRNAFQAAPVLVSTEVLKTSEGRVRALVINSGCANAVTGARGNKDAWAMAAATDTLARELTESGGGYETVVMSTGVIGQHLPIEKITDALGGERLRAGLGLSFGHWEGLARAFMTTDTFPKLRARKFELMGKEVRIVGIDKGAGMIHPNMGPPSESLHNKTIRVAPHLKTTSAPSCDPPRRYRNRRSRHPALAPNSTHLRRRPVLQLDLRRRRHVHKRYGHRICQRRCIQRRCVCAHLS
jgi:glutamate N-acetyltransferase/amino-acid N-acetyltransferase